MSLETLSYPLYTYYKYALHPVHTVNSRQSATSLFAKPLNPPQFPSNNIMYVCTSTNEYLVNPPYSLKTNCLQILICCVVLFSISFVLCCFLSHLCCVVFYLICVVLFSISFVLCCFLSHLCCVVFYLICVICIILLSVMPCLLCLFASHFLSYCVSKPWCFKHTKLY